MVLFAIFAVSAQAPANPVRWRAFASTEGAAGTLTVRALVSDGWHLYGLELPKGGPKATKIDLTGSTGVEFTGDIVPTRRPLTVDDPMFGMKLTWWDSKVDFTAPFKVTDASNAQIKVSVTYMTCDGTTCRPPKTDIITIPVK